MTITHDVTDVMIARLRRMIAEPTEATYTNEDLETLIEETACVDSDGYPPDNDNWTATYDLNKVASEIWGEKASALADEFDYNADGGNYRKNQKYQNALNLSAYYASRAKIVTHSQNQTPVEDEYDEDFTDIYGSIN